MNAQEFRSKLKAFLGDDEYQKLLVHFHEKQRMRFYQQKRWDQFVRDYPELRLAPEQLKIALRVCQVHGDELQLGEAEVYQADMKQVRDFVGARGHMFPHNGTAAVVEEKLRVTLEPQPVWYCPSCRVATEKWKELPTRKFVMPDLRAQYYPRNGVPADELRDVLQTILNSPQVRDKRIKTVSLHPEGWIEIRTGFVNGPLFGGGDIVILRRCRDTWVIDDVSYWFTYRNCTLARSMASSYVTLSSIATYFSPSNTNSSPR